MSKRIDLIGQKFERLKVNSYIEKNEKDFPKLPAISLKTTKK